MSNQVKPILEFIAAPYKWTVKVFNSRSAYAEALNDDSIDFDRLSQYGGFCASYMEDRCTWLGIFDDYYDGILVHEVTHAAMDIFHFVGAKVLHSNQEPFAYFVQNLFQRCQEALKGKPSNTVRKRPRKRSK